MKSHAADLKPVLLNTPRLLIRQVKHHAEIQTAFRVVATPALRQGMEFPPGLTLASFLRGLLIAPPRSVFLLQARAAGAWVGVVVLWQPPNRAGHHQILYGILPEHQGQGLALEACRALLQQLFEAQACPGVMALVNADNLASVATLRRLGLTLRAASGQRLEFSVTRDAYLGRRGDEAP